MFKKVTSIILVCSLILGSTATFATNETEGNLETSQAETYNDPNLKVEEVNVNEYVFSIVQNDVKYECIAKKNGDKVNYIYKENGVIKSETETTLTDAVEVGKNLSSELQSNLNMQNVASATSTYIFDGIVYSRSSISQPFDHPDKSFYGISPYSTWSKNGYSKKYTQVNMYDSNSILNGPAWAVAGGLGAIIGAAAGGTMGAVVGAFLGGLFGGLAGGQITRLGDENGCIWIIMDQSVSSVVISNQVFLKYYHVQIGPFIQNDVLIPVNQN